MNQVIFIGTRQHGLRGRGKLKKGIYLAPFTRVMKQNGVAVFTYSSCEQFVERLRSHIGHRPAFILIYNETHSNLDDPLHTKSVIRTYWPDAPIFDDPETGKILRDKRRLNAVLRNAGIAVPSMIETESSTATVFSNAAIGSHRPVFLRSPGEPLDADRYNTEFVDTSREHRGRRYFICLRAMAVDETLVSVYVRARRTEEGDPSVHSRDTPVDADLINHFYSELVTPNMARLVDLCRQIGSTLGPGFYAHDILPCSDTRRLLVCETGYKLTDNVYRRHLQSLEDTLTFSDFLTDSEATRSAEAFLAAARYHIGTVDGQHQIAGTLAAAWRHFRRLVRPFAPRG